MSRSGYSDDGDGSTWDFIKWRGRIKSAMRGKRGQRLMLDIVQALDALPEKRLIRDQLILETGDVCALGAVGLKRGVVMWDINPDDEYADPYELADNLAAAFDIAPCLAQEVQYVNDEWCWNDNPEKRWQRVRDWAVRCLLPVDIVEDEPTP